MSSPEVAHKDVIIAFLGAGAALAGLVLVFVGLVVANYQSYAADASKKVRDRVRSTAWMLWSVFGLGIVSVALSALWLVIPGGATFYWGCIAVFAADLLAIVLIAGLTTRKLLT